MCGKFSQSVFGHVKMLLQLKTFVILLCVSSIRGTKISLNIHNNSDIKDVSQCVVDIVARNINWFYKPTLAFYESDIQNKDIYNTIIDIIVQNSIPMVSMTSDGYIYEEKYSNDVNFIMIFYIGECTSLINVLDVNLKKNIKYLIILPDHIVLNCNDRLQKTAKNIVTYDVTFLFKDEDDTYILATFMPFIDGTTCKMDDIKLVHINHCKNGTLDKRNDIVFPKKNPKDMMRCPLNVGMGSLYPYGTTFNQTLPNLHPLESGDGSDIQIMKIVANYFNASLNLYNIRTDPDNILLEISFLSYILNGTLDVCAGGLYRSFGDVVSYSGIYSRQAVIWVYTVERDNRTWLTFIDQIDGFYLFFIFQFLYSVVWKIFSHYDNQVISFSNIVLYSCGALGGAACLPDSQTLKKKILNLFYSFLCLHFTAYVTIQLYSLLTIKGPPYVYQDTDDISRSGKPLFMKDRAKYFVEDENYLKFANTSNNCSSFNDCITKTINNKGITVILDGLYAPLQKATAKNDEAKIIKAVEPILVVYHEMLIGKNSLLVGNFDKVITRLFEAGICQKLYEDSIGVLVIDKAWRVNQNILLNSYSCVVGCKISLSDCAGAFYAWFLGCIVACCIFCVEILSIKG